MDRIPNVIVVLADDLATWALGCYGNAEIRTPNIDQLAEDGIRFTEFYCTSPVCSPSRASLLTGKMPSAHGVQDWIRQGNGGPSDPGFDYLADHRAYPEILAEHGIICGISGKWHLGDSPQPQKGHSHWFVHPSGGSPYQDAPMYRGGELVETRGYLTDVIADDALTFIRDRVAEGAPFHLNINFTAPHSPWVDQHPRDLVQLYDDCEFETCPQEPRHPWAMQHPREIYNSEQNTADGRKTSIRDQLQGYFAAVSGIDRALGKLREELRRLGCEQDTLIVFTSDNGFNCGHHGLWGKGNATFPANMYDSSVKVPMIVAMPGRLEPGMTVDAMLSGYDLMPTVLDFVGLGYTVPAGLPGRSFVPLLIGETLDRDRAVVVFDEFGPTRMIRTREWKYVHRYPYGPHELFDLVNDPGERINLLDDARVLDSDESERLERASDMRVQLEHWFDRHAHPRFDARLNAITGRGQVGRVGRPGVDAFPSSGP